MIDEQKVNKQGAARGDREMSSGAEEWMRMRGAGFVMCESGKSKSANSASQVHHDVTQTDTIYSVDIDLNCTPSLKKICWNEILCPE